MYYPSQVWIKEEGLRKKNPLIKIFTMYNHTNINLVSMCLLSLKNKDEEEKIFNFL